MENDFYRLWLNRVRKALAACDLTLRVKGEDPATLKLRTDLLVELGRIDEAVACHERMLILQGGIGTHAPASKPAAIDRRSLLTLLGQASDSSIAEFDWQDNSRLAIDRAGADAGPAAIVLHGIDQPGASHAGWPQERVALFNAGYVPLRRMLNDSRGKNVVYARSDLLTEARLAGVLQGPAVSMWNLGRNGRFGNQLWQYLFLTMYGLRNGQMVESPPWEGEDFFGFSNPRPRPRATLVYQNRHIDHLELWHATTPPSDVNFSGYFQDVPPAWEAHRTFIRRLFVLREDWAAPFDRMLSAIRADRFTLVAVHIRRSDDINSATPFRTVPIEWYRTALRELWSRLQQPVLYVASNWPGMAKELSDFPQLTDGALSKLPRSMPDYLRDWIILRESDVLLACDSSFSMMAALQARVGQACMIPDTSLQTFAPFDL